MPMSPLPTGMVTFLFTDVEGSTNLLQLLEDRYVAVIGEHRRLLRAAFHAWGGHEIDTAGDGFFVAFAQARDALNAAVAAQRAIATYTWPEGAPIRVRVGIHTGQAVPAFGGYVGLDVHRAARIMAAGYGGEILLSQATQSLVEGALPDDITLKDLGEHRLKDLSRPERILQVVTPDLPADFPPLRTLDVISNNLPIQLTSFIGRERETNDVKRLLTTTRLLTLQGAGGAGKSRLAIQIAADLIEDYQHGVWFVDLAPLTDPAQVPRTVAATLGVREVAGRTLVDTLIDFLRPKTLLLILDNCEHLLTPCAHLAEALLQACPNLRLLATSREAMRIAGETAYSVPSLSLPETVSLGLDDLLQYEAVRLFADRAAAMRPDFTINVETARAAASICRQLDGMPLAIELAAARVKALTPEQIAGRLSDRFLLLTQGSRTALPRHQTLQGAIDWSHDLLTAEERILLRRLAVFAGGWALEGAEAVCAGEGLDRRDILDLLTRLVDRSLVVVEGQNGTMRYRILETVRQYASEKLGEAGERTQVRERHAQWYLALTEEAEPMLRGPEQSVWLKRLEREYGNLRAALAWSVSESGDREQALRLAGNLWRFWNVRGYLSEWGEWLARAQEASQDATPAVRARSLFAAAVLGFLQRADHRAASLLQQALGLYRELNDKLGVADCLRILAQVLWERADYPGARFYADESLKTYRELKDKTGIAAAVRLSGFVLAAEELFAEARAHFEESLRLARELGDSRGIAWSLNGLGIVVAELGDEAEGGTLNREALALFKELGDRRGMADALTSLGILYPDLRWAIRLLRTAEILRVETGLGIPAGYGPAYERRLAALKQTVGEETFAAEWAKGHAISLEQAIAYVAESQPSDSAVR